MVANRSWAVPVSTARVTYAFVGVKDGIPFPRDALREAAGRRAESCGLNEQEWSWVYRGNDIIFCFAKGGAGDRAAQLFAIDCTTWASHVGFNDFG